MTCEADINKKKGVHYSRRCANIIASERSNEKGKHGSQKYLNKSYATINDCSTYKATDQFRWDHFRFFNSFLLPAIIFISSCPINFWLIRVISPFTLLLQRMKKKTKKKTTNPTENWKKKRGKNLDLSIHNCNWMVTRFYSKCTGKEKEGNQIYHS